MEKAILVIDMPKDCRECPCFYDWLHCQAKDGLNVVGDERPEGCPLKPTPQKLAENFGNNTPTNTYIMNGNERQYLDMFAVGYNRCIDEIVGG